MRNPGASVTATRTVVDDSIDGRTETTVQPVDAACDAAFDRGVAEYS